jgi:outer membrane protein OmpA-like peptidoglycan-associated protein
VAACAGSSRHATAPQEAAEHAEAEKKEAQEEARDARRDADKARQDARMAAQAQREADQNAQWAAQRASQAEAQAAQAPPRGGATERQPEYVGAAGVAKRTVWFATNSADLSAEAKGQLDEESRALRNKGHGYLVVLEGYSDGTGNEADNAQLSRHRADAVANYLESTGIPGDRITTRGLGSRNPAGKEETNRGRALDRRVEIVVEAAAK